MIPVAFGIQNLSRLTGKKMALNVFAIKMITIHRWFKYVSLSPQWFCVVAVYLLSMREALHTSHLTDETHAPHRRIDAAEKDLGYKPIVGFEEAWADTALWYKRNWLPEFLAKKNGGGIAK